MGCRMSTSIEYRRAAVSALAQALNALAQGEEERYICVAEQFDNFIRQPDVSPETRSVVGQLAGAMINLRVERLVAAVLEQIPQEMIDMEAEDILRRSQEEGTA